MNNNSIIIITHKRTWVGGLEWRVPLVTDDSSSSCSPASPPSSHHLWLGVALHLRKYIRKRNPNPVNLNWIDIAGIEIGRFIFYTVQNTMCPTLYWWWYRWRGGCCEKRWSKSSWSKDRLPHTLHCRPSFEGELLFPACGSLWNGFAPSIAPHIELFVWPFN